MMLGGQFSVGELAEAFELPTAMASECPRFMQRCGFLDGNKQGRQIFYRGIDPHVHDLISGFLIL